MSELVPQAAPRRGTRTSVDPSDSLAFRAVRAALQVSSAASPALAVRLAERMLTTPRRPPRPAHEREALARARQLEIPMPNARPLAAWEWGDVGPRVLLAHGWQGRGAQLAPIGERLAALGFRAVCFDAPAHGGTPGTTCTFFDLSAAIEEAARALGPLHALVAHSFGAAATTWAVRTRGLADRYAMISAPADLRDLSRGFVRVMGLSDEIRERLDARLEERYRVSLDDVVVERCAARQSAPLLVVHDVDDREIPFDDGRRLADAWPGATLLRTEGLGHRRILRDPDVVRAIERFVTLPSA